MLARLQRQIVATGYAELVRLLAELHALSMPPDCSPVEAAGPLHDVSAPLTLKGPLGLLNFITIIIVFGAPHDVTLAELAVETLLPPTPPRPMSCARCMPL